MRGLATYLLAGALAALAMDISVSPGSAIGAWPQIKHADVIAPISGQSVNRSSKGDRLDLKQTVVGKSRAVESAPPAKPALLPQGCEPAFSTLTASAAYAGNFVRGCIS